MKSLTQKAKNQDNYISCFQKVWKIHLLIQSSFRYRFNFVQVINDIWISQIYCVYLLIQSQTFPFRLRLWMKMVTYLLALQSKLFLGFGQCNFLVSFRFGHLDIVLKLFHKYFLTWIQYFRTCDQNKHSQGISVNDLATIV